MREPASATRRLEISGELDRYTAERLRLEVRALARRFGLDVTGVAVEPATEPPSQ